MVFVLVALLALAACGGEGSAGGPVNTVDDGPRPVTIDGPVNDHGTETITGHHVDVEMHDVYFAPTYLRAGRGRTVAVELDNRGELAQTFTVDALGVDVTVAPGVGAQVELDLPDHGPIEFHCRFHADDGMRTSTSPG